MLKWQWHQRLFFSLSIDFYQTSILLPNPHRNTLIHFDYSEYHHIDFLITVIKVRPHHSQNQLPSTKITISVWFPQDKRFATNFTNNALLHPQCKVILFATQCSCSSSDTKNNLTKTLANVQIRLASHLDH